jgi:hypothetical protein
MVHPRRRALARRLRCRGSCGAEEAYRARFAAAVARTLNERCRDESIATFGIGNAAAPGALADEAIHVERKPVVVGDCRAHDVPTIGRPAAAA